MNFLNFLWDLLMFIIYCLEIMDLTAASLQCCGFKTVEEVQT